MSNPWHHTAKARILLDALAPSDFHITIHRNVVGPDQWVFQHDALQKLERVRAEWIDHRVGHTFAQDRRAWLDASYLTPTVQEALTERFGDPVALFGAVPGILCDAVAANARWSRINETSERRAAA